MDLRINLNKIFHENNNNKKKNNVLIKTSRYRPFRGFNLYHCTVVEWVGGGEKTAAHPKVFVFLV